MKKTQAWSAGLIGLGAVSIAISAWWLLVPSQANAKVQLLLLVLTSIPGVLELGVFPNLRLGGAGQPRLPGWAKSIGIFLSVVVVAICVWGFVNPTDENLARAIAGLTLLSGVSALGYGTSMRRWRPAGRLDPDAVEAP